MSRNLLIEPEALATELNSDDGRIFDCAVFLEVSDNGYRARSGLEGYLEAHIPGAGFIDLVQAFADTTSGLGFTLPETTTLRSAAEAAGVGDSGTTVLYSSGHMMWATRAFWLLAALGLKNVRVLNASLAGWKDAGLPIEAGAVELPPATIGTAPEPQWFVDLEGMRNAANGGACTVNALSEALYTGEGDFHYGRRGHIPGSRHLYYEALMTDGAFNDNASLETALKNAGMLGDERVVTYCGGGIAATLDAFALRLVGKNDVAVYDGSMSEWVRAGEPLREGAEP